VGSKDRGEGKEETSTGRGSPCGDEKGEKGGGEAVKFHASMDVGKTFFARGKGLSAE